MFTGIVDHCGTVTEIKRGDKALSLRIACAFTDLVSGESVCVDGACLTVTAPVPGYFVCDVSPETLALTAIGELQPGAKVHLERAMRLSDRLGGHLVTGHIDARAELKVRVPVDGYLCLAVCGVSAEHRRFLMKKGSVALSGVSLTVNDVTEDGFEVLLIPHTLERTKLGDLMPGDAVNLEFDWMTKVILNDLKRKNV